MPLDFIQSKQQISMFRLSREETEVNLAENQNNLTRLEQEQTYLVSTGAPADEIQAVQANLEMLKSQRRALRQEVSSFNAEIASTLGDLIVQVQPEELFKQLDGTVPIALLPSRLETRFSPIGEANRLRIRIYPDQVHIDAHSPGLLPQELALGQQYWEIRRQNNAEQLKTAWIRLSQTFSPTRAAWIVQQLTPTNFNSADANLSFPDVPQRLDSKGDVPRAKLLPDRWVALGYQRSSGEFGEYQQLFRKWGNTVPDTLNVTVSFDEQAEPIEGDDVLPIDSEMLWTVDYEEAEKVGMAITIDAKDLPLGKSLASGVDLLVVMGVDWTVSPEAGADNLSSLLTAHHFAEGMAFVPQGTPTNNTNPSHSGFTTDPVALAQQIDPTAQSERPVSDHAAARMAQGMGLLPSSILERLPNAGLQEQAITSLVADALWESTLGYYLDELINPLATDNFIDLARDHAAHYLHPFGPFSSFRIGKQPYGLLPIMAPKNFKPDQEEGVEKRLERILRVLSWYWRFGLRDVPFMGKSDDPDDDLLALLQLNPVSVAKKFRRAVDSETATNLKGLESYAEVQSYVLRSLVLDQFASFAGSQFNAGKIAQMLTAPTNHPLPGPWTQVGSLVGADPLDPNYVQIIIKNIEGGTQGRIALHQQTKSSVLLEALLAHAAIRELDKAINKTKDKHGVETGMLQARPLKSSLQTRSLIGIHTAASAQVQANQVLVETPEQLAALVIPAITGDRTLNLSDFISQQLLDPQRPETPEFRNLDTFVTSLKTLSTHSAVEIDRSFRAILDCYSHRLDAWFTSLASRRLKQVRDLKPVGIQIGGYGWVENLRPDIATPDSLGFVHTPSVAHAATAAIMRSGHLSHRGYQNARRIVTPNTAESALNIDLSSERVRTALSILEGIAQGQSIAALLGYRFERLLRDRDIRLMQFVFPIRKLAPFRVTVPGTNSEVAESIAARDVVDGIQLLEKWRSNRSALLDQIQDPLPTADQKTMIAEQLQALDDILDAVSDVLVSESVYQTVRGNYERAGAALAALDRQSQPPDPQVIRTPRSGTLYQQKVIILLQDTQLSANWAGLSSDLRAQVEPRLNSWIAQLVGDPTRIILSAEIQDSAQSAAIEPTRLSANLLDFVRAQALSPLSLVLMSVAASAKMPSELELAVARYFAEQVANPTESMSLQLLEEPSESDESVEFAAFLTFLQMINRAIAGHRTADVRDFTPAEGEISPNIDTDDLQVRLNIAKDKLDAIFSNLNSALESTNLTQIYTALQEAVSLGIPDAIPEVDRSAAEAATILEEQAVQVRDLLAHKNVQLQERQQAFDEAADTDNNLVAAHLIQQVRTIFGEHFPIVPLFSLNSANELLASQSDRRALIGEDEFAPLTWLQQLATVRPQIEKYVSLLTASEMLGTPILANQLQVMQLPHVPGQSWAGLTLPEPPSSPLLSLVTVGSYSLNHPLAGLVCDGWSEIIPATTEMTGISFHYDAPAARAPQAILLAVPPELNQKNWTFEPVVNSILHAHELARLRAVGPREIPVLGGGMLPMVYLPQDKTNQIPSIDFGILKAYWENQTGQIIGRMNSHAYSQLD